MRSNLITLLLGASLVTASTSCATKSGTGAGVGAVAGGVAGHAIGGTAGLIIGAAAGGALGYTLGSAMEEEDRRRAAYALEYNRPTAWRNPDTGYEYRVEPLDRRSIGGRDCREFRMFAEVDGRPDEVTGTACRTPDGRWEALSG